jgi:peroxiredoxin
MPIIEKYYRETKDKGFIVLAVNFKQPENKVRAYMDKLNLSFPVALDPNGEISEQYQVRGLPWNFVINKAGILKDILVGEIANEQMLQEFFEPYI